MKHTTAIKRAKANGFEFYRSLIDREDHEVTYLGKQLPDGRHYMLCFRNDPIREIFGWIYFDPRVNTFPLFPGFQIHSLSDAIAGKAQEI